MELPRVARLRLIAPNRGETQRRVRSGKLQFDPPHLQNARSSRHLVVAGRDFIFRPEGPFVHPTRANGPGSGPFSV